jgi:RNA polymerase subunit RPABC4/transcription elongation factor Spt4
MANISWDEQSYANALANSGVALPSSAENFKTNQNYHSIDLWVWIILPILYFSIISATDSIGKSERNKNKKNKLIYLVWFLALIAPPLVIQLLIRLGAPVNLSLTSSYLLTIMIKLFVIFATLWVGSKLQYKIVWSMLLSLLTLAPFGPWIALIFIFTLRTKERYCGKCDKFFSGDKEFCEVCGTKLIEDKKICKKCMKTFAYDKKHCSVCGTELISKNEHNKEILSSKGSISKTE